jgi:hypothetical protein
MAQNGRNALPDDAANSLVGRSSGGYADPLDPDHGSCGIFACNGPHHVDCCIEAIGTAWIGQGNKRRFMSNRAKVPHETTLLVRDCDSDRNHMKALQNRNWPGNVRELENLIERSIVLTKGTTQFVNLAICVSLPRSGLGVPHAVDLGLLR